MPSWPGARRNFHAVLPLPTGAVPCATVTYFPVGCTCNSAVGPVGPVVPVASAVPVGAAPAGGTVASRPAHAIAMAVIEGNIRWRMTGSIAPIRGGAAATAGPGGGVTLRARTRSILGGTVRRIRTTTLAFVTLLAVGLAACGGASSGDSKAIEPMPKAWSAAGKAKIDQLIAKTVRATGKECAPINFLSPQALETTRQRYDWRIAPTAIADCERDPETIEWATFSSTSDRDRFVDERTTGLCARAAATGADLPPFAWVKSTKGMAWSVQADDPATAKSFAKALGGETDVRRCDRNDTLGWRRSGIANVRGVAAKLVGAGVPCSGLALIPRKQVVGDAPTAKTPAAVAECSVTTPSGATGATGGTATSIILIAAFDKQSQTVDAFLKDTIDGTGFCQTPTSAVTGSNFAVILPTPYAETAAQATGGTVARSCG